MSNVKTEKSVREPLFHIAKRGGLPLWKGILIRFIAIFAGLLVCGIFVTVAADGKKGFFDVFASLFSGAFGTERRRWLLLQDTALLLGVSLALVPAFKMKFWNLGGNGQILMGCLTSTMCMFYLGGKLPDPVVWLIMTVSAIAAGALWAVIPALFKAFFRTNESLFTLMMNYIAFHLVSFFISYWYPKGTGTMTPLEAGVLPDLFGNKYLLTLFVVVLLTVFMFAYLRFSKHGYELSVVGESENTARYIGVNVKGVIIRTLLLSGAICGIVGLLISGSINHAVGSNYDNNMGFTAIMAAWLGKFDPIIIVLTSFFITFLTRGMDRVLTDFDFTSEALSSVIIGIIYFCVIACEFFISYQIKFNGEHKKTKKPKKNRFEETVKRDFAEEFKMAKEENFEENKEEK